LIFKKITQKYEKEIVVIDDFKRPKFVYSNYRKVGNNEKFLEQGV